ncbi:MAG: hypothetical protein V4736_00760 [Bdellovibrionota bacterium]
MLKTFLLALTISMITGCQDGGPKKDKPGKEIINEFSQKPTVEELDKCQNGITANSVYGKWNKFLPTEVTSKNLILQFDNGRVKGTMTCFYKDGFVLDAVATSGAGYTANSVSLFSDLEMIANTTNNGTTYSCEGTIPRGDLTYRFIGGCLALGGMTEYILMKKNQ